MAGAIVYYHADCLDGFGAAYGAWRRLGDGALYRPMHHGQPWREDEVRNRRVFILDFSFSRDALESMAATAAAVVQLDHHGTARNMWRQELGPAGPGLQRHRHPWLPLEVAFDLDKSGARLAWEHFHPDQPLPLALQHIEDQDLWRFRLEHTRPFCRALRLLPFDFCLWDERVRECGTPDSPAYRQLCVEGAAIDLFMAREAARLADSALVMPVQLPGEAIDPLQALRHGLPLMDTEHGHRRLVPGLAINASSLFASELGQLLARRSGSFGLVWQLGGDGRVKASLRAENRIDVAVLAEQFGGGGHPNAAGFRMELERFRRTVLGLD